MTRRYCLTLDLQDDPALIAEYKRQHQKIWPEITQSIKDVGIEQMEIYSLGTRLFMIMEVDAHFSFEKKAAANRNNPKVQEWETTDVEIPAALARRAPRRKMAAHG